MISKYIYLFNFAKEHTTYDIHKTYIINRYTLQLYGVISKYMVLYQSIFKCACALLPPINYSPTSKTTKQFS